MYSYRVSMRASSCHSRLALGPWLLLAAVGRLFAQDDFHGCGMAGSAKPAGIQAVNRLKNRYTPPDGPPADVTLQAMLMPGDDTNRFDETKGAEVIGWVYDVKPGGNETCNCRAADLEYRDTHIELVPSPTLNDPTHRVIVEVTPRWRAIMASQGIDWSTATLRKQLWHKKVRIRGWLLFDVEHANSANQTNPGGTNVWRATAWEIHPITRIDVAPSQ